MLCTLLRNIEEKIYFHEKPLYLISKFAKLNPFFFHSFFFRGHAFWIWQWEIFDGLNFELDLEELFEHFVHRTGATQSIKF